MSRWPMRHDDGGRLKNDRSRVLAVEFFYRVAGGEIDLPLKTGLTTCTVQSPARIFYSATLRSSAGCAFVVRSRWRYSTGTD
jgi:hypothetical protein